MDTGPITNRPYFFLLGAMKAGTADLYLKIKEHPSVRGCKRKEPNFFIQDDSGKGGGTWDNGLGWYDSLFEPGTGLRGEASTRYSRFPNITGVADRMYRTLENPKFLYLVRNPVDRAISQFVYSTLKGTERRPIQEALGPTSTSSYITAGLYHLQLSIFLTRFRRDQFHVITSDELWNYPDETMRDVYRFLQLSPHPLNLSKESPANSVALIAQRLKDGEIPVTTEQQQQLLGLWEDLPEMEKRSSNSIAARLGLSEAQRCALFACFTEDLAALEHFIGRGLPAWS